MLFREDHIEAIRAGEKTVTRRDWERRQVVEGGVYIAATELFTADEEADCYIRVTDVYEEPLGAITPDQAAREGGYSVAEFEAVWREINDEWKPDQEVTVVEFEYVGRERPPDGGDGEEAEQQLVTDGGHEPTTDRDRVMVDIETLGVEPGAAIVSIGAVRFGPGGLGETFERSIDLKSCEFRGLQIDAETLEWWLNQGEVAREQLIGGDDLRARRPAGRLGSARPRNRRRRRDAGRQAGPVARRAAPVVAGVDRRPGPRCRAQVGRGTDRVSVTPGASEVGANTGKDLRGRAAHLSGREATWRVTAHAPTVSRESTRRRQQEKIGQKSVIHALYSTSKFGILTQVIV